MGSRSEQNNDGESSTGSGPSLLSFFGRGRRTARLSPTSSHGELRELSVKSDYQTYESSAPASPSKLGSPQQSMGTVLEVLTASHDGLPTPVADQPSPRSSREGGLFSRYGGGSGSSSSSNSSAAVAAAAAPASAQAAAAAATTTAATAERGAGGREARSSLLSRLLKTRSSVDSAKALSAAAASLLEEGLSPEAAAAAAAAAPQTAQALLPSELPAPSPPPTCGAAPGTERALPDGGSSGGSSSSSGSGGSVVAQLQGGSSSGPRRSRFAQPGGQLLSWSLDSLPLDATLSGTAAAAAERAAQQQQQQQQQQRRLGQGDGTLADPAGAECYVVATPGGTATATQHSGGGSSNSSKAPRDNKASASGRDGRASRSGVTSATSPQGPRRQVHVPLLALGRAHDAQAATELGVCASNAGGGGNSTAAATAAQAGMVTLPVHELAAAFERRAHAAAAAAAAAVAGSPRGSLLSSPRLGSNHFAQQQQQQQQQQQVRHQAPGGAADGTSSGQAPNPFGTMDGQKMAPAAWQQWSAAAALPQPPQQQQQQLQQQQRQGSPPLTSSASAAPASMHTLLQQQLHLQQQHSAPGAAPAAAASAAAAAAAAAGSEGGMASAGSSSSVRAGSPFKPRPPAAGASPQRSRPGTALRQSGSAPLPPAGPAAAAAVAAGAAGAAALPAGPAEAAAEAAAAGAEASQAPATAAAPVPAAAAAADAPSAAVACSSPAPAPAAAAAAAAATTPAMALSAAPGCPPLSMMPLTLHRPNALAAAGSLCSLMSPRAAAGPVMQQQQQQQQPNGAADAAAASAVDQPMNAGTATTPGDSSSSSSSAAVAATRTPPACARGPAAAAAAEVQQVAQRAAAQQAMMQQMQVQGVASPRLAPQQVCAPIAIARHCPRDLQGANWQPRDFVQTKKLYEGKIAAVVQGYHAASGRPLALKVYNRARLDTMERFQLAREVCLHMRSCHPAITTLYAAFKDSRYIYLLMELAPSGNLYQMLMAMPVAAGRPRCLPERDAVVRVIKPLLSALGYLHDQGIIHRDIKLENVLLTADGSIKLADFGLSIDTRHEPANTRLGTQGYFAPEVLALPLKASPFEGKSPEEAASRGGYDCKVDVWSAGVVCFEVLTGRAPFAAENVAQVLQAILHRQLVYPGHLSTEAVSFLSTALTRDPCSRPTVRQLLQHPFITTHTA